MINRLLLVLALALTMFTVSIKAQVPIEPMDTDADGYRNVTTLNHLRWISEVGGLTLNYTLDNNIDATATSGWNGTQGFLGIGIDSLNSFRGIFNGQGYTISNILMNSNATECIGFFRIINGGYVYNLNLSACTIYAYDSHTVGCLAGGVMGQYAKISNCNTVNCIVQGNYMIGGLIGCNWEGTITNCIADCDVTGDWSGGFIAWNGGCIPPWTNLVLGAPVPAEIDPSCLAFNSTIDSCYSIGSVTGNYSGGFVGFNAKHGNISKSSCTNYISGDYNGGFVYNDIFGNINNCYSRSNLAGSGSGFVETCEKTGINYGDITRCYSTGQLNGTGSACFYSTNTDYYNMIHYCLYEDNAPVCPSLLNHFESRNTASMKNSLTYTGLLGWDFSNIWEINLENNGYPSYRGMPNRKFNLENNIKSYSSDISIFPNPATNLINIEYNIDTKTTGSIFLYNYNGQLIAKLKSAENLNEGLNNIQYDIKDLIQGSYYITINYNGINKITSFSVVR